MYKFDSGRKYNERDLKQRSKIFRHIVKSTENELFLHNKFGKNRQCYRMLSVR